MSRLDRHVAGVQNRLALNQLLLALGWCVLGLNVLIWISILADRLLGFDLPRSKIWLLVGCGVSLALAIGYAIWRRPTRHQAAVAIDEKLQLKEKFSTALYVRPSNDPFAQAA